jgi:hypothetical protein
VSVRDFLKQRSPVPHLFDLAPVMDPSAFEPGGVGPGAPVFGTIRTEGDRQTDVRLLVDDGESYLELATALAQGLRCDVYLTPDGSEVRYVRETGLGSDEFWDAVAVDKSTGEPTHWLVVRPDDLPQDVPTWFVTTRGRLRQSDGLVTVLLPDGIGFATKTTFRDTAYLAARMCPVTSRVTTVAVNADSGRFAISRFDDAGALLGGAEFATLLAASLDTIQPDVQLALTWPAEAAACATLNAELIRLADALNRTVWVPQPQGAAFVLPGCGEFAAVDEVGGPSTWRAYPPRQLGEWQPPYSTDHDGRLWPLGVEGTVSCPEVTVEGLFAIDLSVLRDGRLGVPGRDGVRAVGPRQLRAMMREAGWTGSDLLLLAQPPAQLYPATLRHAQSLVDVLAVDLWLPAAGASVWYRPDGKLAADGPSGGWYVVRVGDPVDASTLPPGLVREPMPVGAPRPELTRTSTMDATQILSTVEITPAEIVEPVSVVSPPVDASDGRHAVSWLPPTPVVNGRPLDLYLWTPLANDEVEAWGLPSADMFLLAGQDPLRLAEHRRTGYLLRIQAPEHTAVEVLEHARHAPAAVRQRLQDSGCTHLLPLAWFGDVRVTARFDLDGRGGVTARRDINASALAIRFEGADHGVPGLPNEVMHWPGKGQRATATYLTVPDQPVLDRQIVHRGYVALSRRKPPLEEGQRILEVRVRGRRAINVPATMDLLGGLPVMGRMHDFVGLDLLLPEDDLAMAVLTKSWRYGQGGKPVVDKLPGRTLSEEIGHELALVA